MAASTECADGIDNDFDGKIDYPQDPQCLSLHDQSEGPSGRGVFLDLTDGLASVKANGHMTYTVALTTDRKEQTNVDVQFFIPHQTNVLSANEGGRIAGDYVLWRNVTVFPGQTHKLYVNVDVKPRADQNLLVVAKAYADGEEATDITRIEGIEDDPEHQPVHQLRLSVSDGKAYAEPNEKLLYRIVVDNTGGPGRRFTLRTDLPVFLTVLDASGSPSIKGDVVEWAGEEIDADEVREYFLSAFIDRGATENATVQLKVSSGPSIARDTTGVLVGAPGNALTATISDGLVSAAAKEYVSYTVAIQNRTSRLVTDTDVTVALPSNVEFVSATEGGMWTGKNVRWTGLVISPNGGRSLQVTGRIRSSATPGTRLRATASVGESLSSDTTVVSDKRMADGAGGGVSADGKSSSFLRVPVLLRMEIDRREARPGDTVNYTIRLRNTTGRTISAITVQERSDNEFLQITDAPRATRDGDRMVWNIPSLAPGEEWRVRYTARVSERAQNGASLRTVASVSGYGIENISLSERVNVASMQVITNLPPSGIGFGGIFLGFTGLLGAAQAGMTRKKRGRRSLFP